MRWSILDQGELISLRELGTKLKSGTKSEQTVGDFILEYTKDRIPIPSKYICRESKPMFQDNEAANEALAH